MGKRLYYRRWASNAFRHSIGIGDGVAFLIGISIPIIRQFVPAWESVMNELAWQIPLGIFSAVIFLRLILAPYWMYKDKEKEVETIKQEKRILEEKTKETEQRTFSIEWDGKDSYWIRNSNGGRYSFDTAYERETTTLEVEILLEFNTIRKITVEAIELDIDGHIAPPVEEWRSEYLITNTGIVLAFTIPKTVPRGRRIAKICAIVSGAKYIGEPFTLNLPPQKLVPDKGDSQP